MTRVRVGGLDDRVNVPALRSDKGIGEALAKFGDFFLTKFLALGTVHFCQVPLVNNVDRAFRAHHRDFRGGPGKVGVRANVLGSHNAVGAAVGFARNDSNLRNRGFRKSKEQLRTVLNDAAEFLLRPREKTGDVFKSEQRDIEGIAETHEARALHGSVDIKNSREKRRLVADDADGAAVEARETHDKVFGIVLVDFEEIIVVHDGMNRILDIVGFLRVRRNKRVESFVAARRQIGSGAARRILEII